MATSYGYVERNLENDVNWGSVGKGFSDMLIAERDERAAKKKSLDDAMMETQDGISKNAPLGYNTDFNDRMIDFASNSSSFVLAANKDLKAGRITPEEYMRKLQRINSSADTVFGLANNFNEWYDDKLKRMDSKESGVVEQATFEIMSKLVDFNKHDFFIDKSGMVVAAPLVKGEDGITRPDTANARSVQAIFNLAQNTVNRVDVDKTIQEKIKLLGKRVVSREVAASYAAKGEQVTLEGLRYTDPDEYDKWKRAIIKEMTASDLDVASILGDYADEYEITGDAKTYDKNTQILLDLSEGKEVKVSLTENQKDRAFQVLSDAIDAQAGGSDIRKEIKQEERSWAERSYYINAGKEAKKEIDALGNMAKIFQGGSDAEVQEGIKFIRSTNPNIEKMVRTPTGLTVTYFGGASEDLSFKDMNVEQWITANGNYLLDNKISDIKTLLKKSGINLTQGLNTTTSYTDMGTAAPVKPKNAIVAIKYLEENNKKILKGDLFFDKNNKDVVSTINAAISPYGATVGNADTGYGNNVTIKAANNNEITVNTNQKNMTDAWAQQEMVIAFLKNNLTDEVADRSSAMGFYGNGDYSRFSKKEGE